jgi:hypothetical protein
MPWKCPNCGYVLYKMFLRAFDMAVGIDTSEVFEVCPNDGISLVAIKDES